MFKFIKLVICMMRSIWWWGDRRRRWLLSRLMSFALTVVSRLWRAWNGVWRANFDFIPARALFRHHNQLCVRKRTMIRCWREGTGTRGYELTLTINVTVWWRGLSYILLSYPSLWDCLQLFFKIRFFRFADQMRRIRSIGRCLDNYSAIWREIWC
jgi:hypothetical protein